MIEHSRPALPGPITFRWVWTGLRTDVEQAVHYAADFSGSHLSALRRLSIMMTPSLMCIATYRVAHWLHRKGLTRVARALSWLNFVVHRADLSPSSEIGPGFYLPHTCGVVFRGRAGSHLTLYFRCAVLGGRMDSRVNPIGRDCPRLGNHVTVGMFSVIRGGVTIDDHTFVGVAAPVLRSLPEHSTVVGGRHPAWRARGAQAT